LEDEVELEAAGLAVGGRKRGKGMEGEMERAVREAGERYDGLIEMFEEGDDVGREKARGLKREVKRLVDCAHTQIQNRAMKPCPASFLWFPGQL